MLRFVFWFMFLANSHSCDVCICFINTQLAGKSAAYCLACHLVSTEALLSTHSQMWHSDSGNYQHTRNDSGKMVTHDAIDDVTSSSAWQDLVWLRFWFICFSSTHHSTFQFDESVPSPSLGAQRREPIAFCSRCIHQFERKPTNQWQTTF